MTTPIDRRRLIVSWEPSDPTFGTNVQAWFDAFKRAIYNCPEIVMINVREAGRVRGATTSDDKATDRENASWHHNWTDFLVAYSIDYAQACGEGRVPEFESVTSQLDNPIEGRCLWCVRLELAHPSDTRIRWAKIDKDIYPWRDHSHRWHFLPELAPGAAIDEYLDTSSNQKNLNDAVTRVCINKIKVHSHPCKETGSSSFDAGASIQSGSVFRRLLSPLLREKKRAH